MFKIVSIVIPTVLSSNEPVLNQRIFDLIQRAKNEAYASIPANSPIGRVQDRAVDTSATLSAVGSYGCWCTKAYSGVGYRGKPIDELEGEMLNAGCLASPLLGPAKRPV